MMTPRPPHRTALLALLLLLPTLPAAAQGQRATVEKAVVSVSALRPGDKATAAVVLDIKPGYHAQSRTPTQDFYIKFDAKVDENAALTVGEVVYPKGENKMYPELGMLNVYEGKTIVRIPIEVKADAKPGPLKITGQLKYQICDDKVCFPPERTKFTIETKVVGKGEAVTPAEPDLFGAEKAQASAGASVTVTTPVSVQVFLIAFLVGIVFNVMPCVLPVVPLKAVGFYEVSQHNRAKSVALGAVFSLGLIASFATLGLLIFVLQALDWGGLFQNFYFRLAIVLVLLVMALGTFGAGSLSGTIRSRSTSAICS